MLRLDYLLATVPLEGRAWTSLESIVERMWQGWTESDQLGAVAQNPRYQEALNILEAAERAHDLAAIEGPSESANRDPELIAAANSLARLKCFASASAAATLALRDPRSIIPARNALFAMFGGKVPLRPAVAKPGTKPYLVARVALNRNVLLEAAASAAGCRNW
jgi:hypothetical protein